jgi:hypothetical protein
LLDHFAAFTPAVTSVSPEAEADAAAVVSTAADVSTAVVVSTRADVSTAVVVSTTDSVEEAAAVADPSVEGEGDELHADNDNDNASAAVKLEASNDFALLCRFIFFPSFGQLLLVSVSYLRLFAVPL